MSYSNHDYDYWLYLYNKYHLFRKEYIKYLSTYIPTIDENMNWRELIDEFAKPYDLSDTEDDIVYGLMKMIFEPKGVA